MRLARGGVRMERITLLGLPRTARGGHLERADWAQFARELPHHIVDVAFQPVLIWATAATDGRDADISVNHPREVDEDPLISVLGHIRLVAPSSRVSTTEMKVATRLRVEEMLWSLVEKASLVQVQVQVRLAKDVSV